MRITTYIEGVESFGQALCRPLTICCGSSYNKSYQKLKPNLLSKISLVALAIIFFPMSVPLIALGCLLVARSEEHKKCFSKISDGRQTYIRKNLQSLKGEAHEGNFPEIVQKITTYERISFLSAEAKALPPLLKEILALVEAESLKDKPESQKALNALRLYA